MKFLPDFYTTLNIRGLSDKSFKKIQVRWSLNHKNHADPLDQRGYFSQFD
jgi:hypothetical protein